MSMNFRLVQKSKSVAQIMRNREVVGEIRMVRDGFKLIAGGESFGTFASKQAAWDHFAEPIRRRNREIRQEQREFEAQARRGEHGQDWQDMMKLMDAMGELNQSLEK